MNALRTFAVLMLALPIVSCSNEQRATWLGDCASAEGWLYEEQSDLDKARINLFSARASLSYEQTANFDPQQSAKREQSEQYQQLKKSVDTWQQIVTSHEAWVAKANAAVASNCKATQAAAAPPAGPSAAPTSTPQPQGQQQQADNTPPPDTSSAPVTTTTAANPCTPAAAANPCTPAAAANPCTTACSAGSYCEVQTQQSGLGPPPEAEAAKMAALGPPPQDQTAAPTAGLGPPPQDQPAAPTAGLGPPPPSPAAPPGSSSPAAVPVPFNPLALQPPTAGSNSGNICNPTPPAPPKPGNVCNPTPAAASKPGNICNPSTASKAGNAAQQTAAATPPNNPQSPPVARMNSGQCNTVNGQTTCTDASGNSCTTTAGFCDPTAPQTTKTAAAPTPPTPNAGPLKLKPPTQMASVAQPCNQKSQSASVPACTSKPPYLPWGGRGSATITVSGGQPCGVGWHDTPGGPGGVTVLDSMSVSSPPSHGTLRPQDQHVIIFTPASNYKGQDTFTLTMQEHNGGRSATLSVRVSVTIQ
jgi:Bacterial Ig domain